jgi:plasmid stabilization system protein ParE
LGKREIKPVFWTTRATKDLEKITKFYKGLYGSAKALIYATELRQSTDILESEAADLSQIGAIDETFIHLKHDYRKLIKGDIKITYRIGKTKVYIVRVFDTRQHPNKNK